MKCAISFCFLTAAIIYIRGVAGAPLTAPEITSTKVVPDDQPWDGEYFFYSIDNPGVLIELSFRI